MAFRASNVVPSDAYTTLKRAAVQLKLNLEGFNNQMLAGDVGYDFLGGVYATLVRANNQFDALKVTPGLATYAQIQEDDVAYDVAAEFNGMQGAIATAVAWLEANVPTNVSTTPVTEWGDNGAGIANTFTPAQTAGLRTQLTGVIATIS